MEFTGAVLAIGSLFWETTADRVSWRTENFDLSAITKCKVPIRYGRKSAEFRKGTYSMVFSNELEKSQYGQGILLSLKEIVVDYESFTKVNKALAKAERIIKDNKPERQSIVTSWGTNCIIINPNLGNEKSETITQWWKKLFAAEKDLHNSRNEQRFSLLNYGLNADSPCIDNDGFLQINFPSEAKVDFLLATASKVKLQEKATKYPNAKEIARAMVDGQYFEYFFNNCSSGIYTSEDRMIKKVLRKKYSINQKMMSAMTK